MSEIEAMDNRIRLTVACWMSLIPTLVRIVCKTGDKNMLAYARKLMIEDNGDEKLLLSWLRLGEVVDPAGYKPWPVHIVKPLVTPPLVTTDKRRIRAIKGFGKKY